MAKTLIVAGLVLLAIGVIIHLLGVLLAVAIPVGGALALIGLIWLLFERAAKRA